MSRARFLLHRRIRLDSSKYAQPWAICSVTVATRDRRPVFADVRLAAAAVDVMRLHAQKTGVRVHGYCFMPDHVHLVLSPSPACDIIRFVGALKNLVQRACWRLGVKGPFWQLSFWDHFLRAEEQIEQVVEYVLDNPVRAGLVTERREYLFSGSLVFDL